jgi:hypothetical protein
VVATDGFGTERIFDREHDAVDSGNVKGTLQRCLGEVAACCEMNIGLKVVSDGLEEAGYTGQGFRGAGEGHRQHLANVTLESPIRGNSPTFAV